MFFFSTAPEGPLMLYRGPKISKNIKTKSSDNYSHT